MKGQLIVGPWPGSNVIALRSSDVRVEFARQVEHAFGSDAELIDKWAAAKSCLHGSYDVPSDTEMM